MDWKWTEARSRIMVFSSHKGFQAGTLVTISGGLQSASRNLLTSHCHPLPSDAIQAHILYICFGLAEEEYCEFSHSDTLLYWHWNMVQTPGNLVSSVQCSTLSWRVHWRLLIFWMFSTLLPSRICSPSELQSITIWSLIKPDPYSGLCRPMSITQSGYCLVLTLTVMAVMAVISVKTGQHHNI